MNIIELAKEAGLQLNVHALAYPVIAQQLERFAALVRAEFIKEDLEVLENLRKESIARCEAGMIEAYQLGRAEALEEAAKMLESGVLGHGECAAAIRSLK